MLPRECSSNTNASASKMQNQCRYCRVVPVMQGYGHMVDMQFSNRTSWRSHTNSSRCPHCMHIASRRLIGLHETHIRQACQA